MTETIKLRSSIKPSLKRIAVIRGTLLAAIGMGILLYGTLFMSVTDLTQWGWLMFLVAGVLTAAGLIPYRKLTKLEREPYEIAVIQDLSLTFSSNQHQLFTIPITAIQRFDHQDKDELYGIRIWLQHPPKEKVIIQDPYFDIKAFENRSRKLWECDLFLPYFTERSYKSLQDHLSVDED